MPKEHQKAVSVPKWLWDLADEYFKKHEEELKQYGIRSTTGLITRWVQESIRRGELPEA